jgi:hypothetical protein
MVSMAISNRCRELRAAEALTHESLRIVPLVGPSREDPAYCLLSESTADEIDVTEVDASGEVPVIRVRNRLRERVFLIDGQELVGAKQNRILNTDVLIPAEQELTLPVSCVEGGRWGYTSAKFVSGGTSAFRSSRARKSSSVYHALKSRRGHRADQAEVWAGITDLHASLGTSSATSAMRDAYEQRQAELEKARATLKLPEDAVGFAVYQGDRFLGLDLFDRVSTVSKTWQALVDSYVLDWLAYGRETEASGAGEPEGAQPTIEQVLEQLAGADWEIFQTPGEGQDLRWNTDRFTGSALVWQERSALHLQLFPRERSSGPAPRRERRTPRAAARQFEGPAAGVRCAGCGFLYGTVRTEDGIACNHCGRRETRTLQ